MRRFAVGHEFNHVIQMRQNQRMASWFNESSAQLMAHISFPDTNLTELLKHQGPMGQLYQPIAPVVGDDFEYGQWIWLEFLNEWAGPTALLRLWEAAAGTTLGITHVTQSVLATYYGTSFDQAIRNYAIWRGFTGPRNDGYHFKDGAKFSNYSPVTRTTAPYSQTSLTNPLKGPGGCTHLRVVGGSGTLNASMDGDDSHKWAAYLIGLRAPLPPIVHELTINSSGVGSFSAPWAEADSFLFVRVVLDTASGSGTANQSFSVTNDARVGIMFANQIHDQDAGGNLLIDAVDTVVSGRYLPMTVGSSHSVKSLAERFVVDSTYKHHDWNHVRSDSKLGITFTVQQSGPQVARFSALNPVKVRNEVQGAPRIEGGNILFRDPWYVNASGAQPDSFVSYSSPFLPSGLAGPSGSGVFLNEGDPSNIQQPYYSVKAPLTQTIGSYQCSFVKWDTVGVTLVQVGSNPSGYDQKAVIFRVKDAILKAVYQATSASISTPVTRAWSMLSPATGLADYTWNVVYPNAVQAPHGWNNGYVQQTTLVPGAGYWVKHGGPTTVVHTGAPVFLRKRKLSAGWNMVGSLSVPLPSVNVKYGTSGAPGSKFLIYNGTSTYAVADTLIPGMSYFLYVSTADTLTLDAASTVNVALPSAWPTPPAVPSEALDAPTLSCSNCATGNAHPSFAWTSVFGVGVKYKLYRYICIYGEGDCEGTGTLIYSGAGTSYTDNGVTVFQKTGASLVPTTTYFYYAVASDTFGQTASSNKLTVNTADLPEYYKAGRGQVGDEAVTVAPTETKLIGSYPNPFNPTSTMRYGLVADGRVSLKVYNTFGQEVANLVDGFQAAGYHEVVFDGSGLASGLYFYRLQAGTYSDTKKLMLLK
jgi:hypothetical protein